MKINSPYSRRGMIVFFSLVILTFGFFSCAKIYVAPEMETLKSKHKKIAIVPFDVSIDAKRLPKGMTVEMLKEQEKDEGYVVQSVSYSYFLKRLDRYSVSFQDVDETNAILTKNNYSYENIRSLTKAELANLLSVDAVFSGKIHRSQPMSTAGAIAVGMLTGYSGRTNEVTIDATIHNGADSKLLWKYNHVISGGAGSSSERMAEALIKEISKKFPYAVR